jgi:hypothetical protein
VNLPNRENAYIQPQKLLGYLLSDTHPVGSSKAKLLRAHGFNEVNADKLEQELLKIAYSKMVQDVVATTHGVKYVLDGEVKAPGGRCLQLRTIWIIDQGETKPRFVTARPLKPSEGNAT